MNQKGFSSTFLSGAVILIVIIGVAGYLLWENKSKPTTPLILDETADWNIYNDNGFTIKYPVDWEIKIDEVGKITHFSPKNKRIPEDVQVFAEVINVEKLEARPYNNPLNFFGKPVPVPIKINIKGKEFYKSEESFEGVRTIMYAVANNDNYKVGRISLSIAEGRQRMDYYLSDDQIKPELDIFNKILSSFDFVENDETVDWKIYRNEKYGFTLLFPSTWEGYRAIVNDSNGGISFELPTSDKEWNYGSGFSSIFAVNIYSISEWVKIYGDINAFEDSPYVFKNDKYVFQFVVSSNGPKDLFGTADDAEKIISTFKFTDKVDTANWKTYRNEEFGFELKYPNDFQSEFTNNEIKIFSTPIFCKADGVEVKGNKIKIIIKQYTGLNFTQTWKSIFGFDFTSNNYDGFEKIGGKTAYYFVQSAEMPFARINYLIEQTPIKMIGIQAYMPGIVYDCNPLLVEPPNGISKIFNQILSTFKFTK